MAEGTQRRLAAIVSTDVVGYSRLMGVDEARTLTALRDHRAELIDAKITEHGGRIVKTMGDGLLLEFPSVVAATQSMVEIQLGMVGRNQGVDEDQRIKFRIGINLGDIIIEGEDILGDGVNIAARVQEIAEPGGVAISNRVHEDVRDRLDADFADSGEQSLKNIARPVRVWQWSPSAATKPTTTDAPLVLPDKPSIAVLPFENLSNDPDQEYFSDGVTEDIITELSRFRELAVVSRNSSYRFKGKSESLKDVGSKLDTQYLVEGSVRKAGQRVRVTAQLIDTQSDVHIWAERYERDLEDIFEVQDDLVRRITSTLVGRLESERQSKTKRQSKSQLRAYDLYLRGRQLVFNLSIDDNRAAGEIIQSALSIEPEYAAALGLMSEVHLRAWFNGWSDDPDKDFAQFLVLAKKADELDDQDSRTQTALAMAYLYHREFDKAKHHFKAALKLNPNDTRGLACYSRHAVFEGDATTAVDQCRQALSLNPYGKYNWHLSLGCFVGRQYDEVIGLLDNIRNPVESVLALLAASYAMVGNQADAKSTFERFSNAASLSPLMSKISTPIEWRVYLSARWPFRNDEDFEHLMGALQRAGLKA